MTRIRSGLFALAAVAVLSFNLPAADPAKDASPFNGKNLDGWQLKDAKKASKWKVGKATVNDKRQLTFIEGEGELVNTESGGVDIFTEAKYADCVVEVEVMVPKGSNSGIYLMGEYEVQVFDSFGKTKLGQGDMGAIYSAAAPKVNASKAPGEWQKYFIEFQAPTFNADGTKKTFAKFLKVTLNGQVLHENVEVKGSTGGGLTGKEGAMGPLMFQGDHGPVAYRNIKISPLKK